MARVAFLGLGKMGFGMAKCVLAAGHQLCVFNRSAGKAEALVRAGARARSTAREAAEGAQAVISMTADDESSRAMWLGTDGALAANLEKGSFVVECSTLSHDWALELASEVSSRGLRYIDAPVTGLPDTAAAGKLTLLIGANPEDLEAARSVLAAFSTSILHFGPVGSGTAYKLMINLMGAVQIAAAAEGMAIAERAGLDPHTVADAIATSQAASPQVVRNTRRMAQNHHDTEVAFTPVLRLKDVDYALRLTRKLAVGSPFGDVARATFDQLCRRGDSQANESKVIEVARTRLPGAT